MAHKTLSNQATASSTKWPGILSSLIVTLHQSGLLSLPGPFPPQTTNSLLLPEALFWSLCA